MAEEIATACSSSNTLWTATVLTPCSEGETESLKIVNSKCVLRRLLRSLFVFMFNINGRFIFQPTSCEANSLVLAEPEAPAS